MNFFDLIGLASRIPYDLIQKLQGDAPKFEQLMALEKQAAPHIDALMPIVKEAETIWNSISPDVQNLLKTIGPQS
jgi:hypothetical protein